MTSDGPSTTSTESADHLRVSDTSLRLPRSAEATTTYDVLLNGRHVWSLLPERDAAHEWGMAVVKWPKALHRYLVGQADVVLRDHVTGATLAETRHVFAGDETREVDVTDSSGHSLVLDKWGRLIRPLSGEDDTLLDELMDEVARLLQVMTDKAGVPAYICYGTLLGAVRDGRLIGHDNDIDVAYLSEHPHPVDVVREGYRVERVLRDEGWVVRRGSGTRLNVRLKLSDGSFRFVDVFTSHWVEGVLYIPSDTGFRLPKSTILPLTTVELMGRPIPAPADSETLLTATYGDSWRVPDPSFKYTTPRWLSRRLAGWFGGLMTFRKHWDSFDSKERHRVPRQPSPFAQWVVEEYPSRRPLVDIGSGTGRDARWFARRHRREVLGLDYCFSAVTRGNRHASGRGLPATYELVNLYDARAVLALGARLSRAEESPDLYARFVLHALERAGQENVIRLASMSLRRGGLLFLEFRTPRDRWRFHTFGEHPRRYLEPADVAGLVEDGGGRVLHQVEGTGLAPFSHDGATEDPVVCRMVASWS